MNLWMQTWQWQRSKENNGGMTVQCNFMNEILAFLLLLLFVSGLRAGILTSEGYLWRNTIENSRVLLNTSSSILRLCDSQRKHLSNAKRERESLLIFHIPRKNHWKKQWRYLYLYRTCKWRREWRLKKKRNVFHFEWLCFKLWALFSAMSAR